MKNLKIVSIVLLIVALMMPADALAKSKKKKKPQKNSPVISYIHGYAGAGYSSMMHKMEGTTNPGGGAGVLGVGYTLKHRKNPLLFKTGLEFMFLNSTTKLTDPMDFTATFNYNDNNLTNHKMDYRMLFEKYKEQHNRFSVGIPIMVGAQFDQVYFTVGTKAVIGMVNNYTMRSNLTTTAKDPEFIDPFFDMSNHTFMTSTPKHGGHVNYGIVKGFGLDLTGSAEFGLILDDWMPRKWKFVSQKGTKKKRKFSYRAALFADYGILNLNTNNTDRGLLNFAGQDVVMGESFELDAKDIHSVTPNSILQTERAYGKALNSLVVGAKFEVMMQVSPDPVKRKKPRKKPRPAPPKKDLPDPPYFFAVVTDFETEKPLDADLKLFKLSEPHDTVFAAVTTAETGYTETRMKSDRFGIFVKRPGYIDYADTVWQINNDTLYVELQPIKENTIVILENLLFETGKTVVKNESSTSSIDEMYKLLTENPGLKIEISGHTDDVGSARFNKRLSEGRAKAIYQIMVERGVDAERMTWRGAGESEPIDTNDTNEGRAANRRVEFLITENNVDTLLFRKAAKPEVKTETETETEAETSTPEVIAE